MKFFLFSIIAAGPLLLLFWGLLPLRCANSRRIHWITRSVWAAFIFSLVPAIFLLAHLNIQESHSYTLFSSSPRMEHTFLFNPLSAVMLVLISFLGAVITNYSCHYLQGDPKQTYFFKWLSLTIGSALTIVIAGNMIFFLIAWIATNIGLHQLLTFYSHRKSALLAARKKLIFNRIGDSCMIAATILIYFNFHSFNFSDIFQQVSLLPTGKVPEILLFINMFLVAGAIIQSAQFPFHSWLPDTLETPTPVSALMHAGIINAGGFLIVRMSPLVRICPAALHSLAIIGVITAVFGSVIMLTQTSIKKSLAFSTVAQMGFMLFQCGLGAFPVAVLHIVAHSLYKAHAFLSSGNPLGFKKLHTPLLKEKGRFLRFLIFLSITSLIVFTSAYFFKKNLLEESGSFVLYSILLVAITNFLWHCFQKISSFLLIVLSMVISSGLIGFYIFLHLIFKETLKELLPLPETAVTSLTFLLSLAFIVTFMVLLIAEIALPYLKKKTWCHVLYVHIYNRFYVNAFVNHLLLKLWPIS